MKTLAILMSSISNTDQGFQGAFTDTGVSANTLSKGQLSSIACVRSETFIKPTWSICHALLRAVNKLASPFFSNQISVNPVLAMVFSFLILFGKIRIFFFLRKEIEFQKKKI